MAEMLLLPLFVSFFGAFIVASLAFRPLFRTGVSVWKLFFYTFVFFILFIAINWGAFFFFASLGHSPVSAPTQDVPQRG